MTVLTASRPDWNTVKDPERAEMEALREAMFGDRFVSFGEDPFPEPAYPERVLSIPRRTDREVSEALELVADGLLRRGFPVIVEDEGLRFCLGTLREDIDYLRAHLAPLEMTKTEEGGACVLKWKGRTEIVFRGMEDLGLLKAWRRQLMKTGDAVRRETAIWNWEDRTCWRSFLANRFGSSVPVAKLEHGIALLVKVLPWVGIRTSMSCHGHGRRPPRIWFWGYHHGRWCEMVFNHLFSDLPISKNWTFDHGSDPGSWDSASWNALNRHCEDREERYSLYDQIQIMARRLFDPDLCERIRSAKAGATDPDDLADRLAEVAITGTEP